MARAEIDMNKDLRQYVTMTVRVRGMKQFRFRLWAVKCLLSLCQWLSPVGLKVEEE